MLLSRGDPTVFFTRPISLGLLLAAAFLILIIILPAVWQKREEALK
jgi:TctA family transporter